MPDPLDGRFLAHGPRAPVVRAGQVKRLSEAVVIPVRRYGNGDELENL